LANRWLGKKREGLSSFGQKGRGMTERGMREVLAGSLWQLLWPSEKGSFAGSGRKNPKQGGSDLFLFLVKIGKI
jgi:hypothetical protein